MLVNSVFLAFVVVLKIPCVISFECFLVAAILMYISTIFFYTTSGEYFINSMLIWSIPGLLLFFRVDTVFLISDDKNVVNIGVGNTLALRKKIIWQLQIARVACRAFSVVLSNLEFTIWITPYGPRASRQIFSSVWRVRNTSTQVKT